MKEKDQGQVHVERPAESNKTKGLNSMEKALGGKSEDAEDAEGAEQPKHSDLDVSLTKNVACITCGSEWVFEHKKERRVLKRMVDELVNLGCTLFSFAFEYFFLFIFFTLLALMHLPSSSSQLLVSSRLKVCVGVVVTRQAMLKDEIHNFAEMA